MNAVDKSKWSTLSLTTVYLKKHKKTSFSGYCWNTHACICNIMLRQYNESALLNEIPEQQLIQNSAARVLTNTRKYDHIMLVLKGTYMR